MTPKLFKDLENFIKTKYGSLLGKQLIDEALITGSISVKRQENHLKSQRRTMIEDLGEVIENLIGLYLGKKIIQGDTHEYRCCCRDTGGH